MRIFLLFALGYPAYADVPNPALIHIPVSDKPINLTSPGFPTDMYPPNLRTHYDIIAAPDYYTLKLTIVSLHLESNCDDYFQIVEFNRPIYTFCGIISAVSPFYFTSRHLLFIFRTNAKENFPGFQLTLERTLWAPNYPLGRCGYQHMATSQDQNLLSQYVPYNYADDTICTWIIAARRGYCVHFTIVSFRTAIPDNLTIESEGHTPYILTGTNYTPPVTLPLYCSPVYFRFVTDDTLTENGFSIIYREHPSPSLTSPQSLLPSKVETKVEFQTSPPSANNTLFSLVLHQLDALIANNLLTAEQLEYVQSQLNDRLEDFSFQLASHVRTITNASCVPVNNTFTAYTPPFPFYEYVMLCLSSVSILFSIFFLLLTCCLSRRLYHLYIVPDKYRPGKYAHTMQYLLILPLISPACAKSLPPDNLLLALWNHAQ